MFLQRASECGNLAATHMCSTFCAFLDCFPASGVRRLDHGFVLTTGLPDPFGNLSFEPRDHEVESVFAELTSESFPSMVFFTEGVSEAASGAAQAAGFMGPNTMPGMAVDIERIPEVVVPDGYRFERLSPTSDPSGWEAAAASAFGLHPEVARMLGPGTIGADSAADAPVQFYQVSCGDEIVGSSMMSLRDGVAGMYSVATVAEHRGKGVGACLTALPLQSAQKLGYRVGILQASAMGRPVYQRLGFEDADSVSYFVRVPGSAN
jgi:GNAT superfamily N-acetyltransferase